MSNEPSEYVTAPEQRFSMPELAPEWYRAMIGMDRESRTLVDPVLAELVRTRASQLNGCAYCVDMHAIDARRGGEQEHRLYALPVWRETPYFTAAERAALALTEAVTLIADGPVPDEVYQEAEKHFAPAELAQLVTVIIAINAWNRIGVTARMSPAPKRS
ncbi:carboxymuconolactone decarboxylase family protein [Kitasatospora sp. NPDC096147]|uniref:carboxymuconolactone decarboxylase family protein n=1 Tax=Kitasatospora sp. NPDC096147 TaxID=3364093 RepID=UPI0037F7365D